MSEDRPIWPPAPRRASDPPFASGGLVPPLGSPVLVGERSSEQTMPPLLPVRYPSNPSPWARLGRWLFDRITRR